jgi:hypothetical protein
MDNLDRPERSRSPWLARVCLLIAIPFAIHLPFLGGGWITDDFQHVGHLEGQSLAGVFVSPDVFGYFRPIPQASLRANLSVAGRTPWVFRLTNLLLHCAVIVTAFFLARSLVGEGEAPFLATLAFVLTPKAHPLAVQWISARPELLMTLFAMLAVLAWIMWDRRRGRGWLAAAFVAYLLAISSKETAALLPLLLLATPPAGRYFSMRRLAAAGGMVAIAAAVLAARLYAGARTPLADLHYDLLAPLGRDLHNARNYFGRAAPAPLALTIVVLLVATRGAWALAHLRTVVLRAGRLVPYAIAWFVGWIALVLPLPARSELYLYGAGFGLCLLVGILAEGLWPRPWTLRAKAAIGILIVAFGSYQAVRASGGRGVAAFSATLAAALAADERLRAHTGVVVLTPEDPATEDLLEAAVGGYFTSLLRLLLNRPDIDGVIEYSGEAAPPGGYRVRCRVRDGRVALSPG